MEGGEVREFYGPTHHKYKDELKEVYLFSRVPNKAATSKTRGKNMNVLKKAFRHQLFSIHIRYFSSRLYSGFSLESRGWWARQCHPPSTVQLLGVTGQEVGKLLCWWLGELSLGPHVRGQVRVGLDDGLEGGLCKVTEGGGLTSGRSVAILYTGHGEELLRGWGADDAGTTWGRDETDHRRAALGRELARHGVWNTNTGAPVSSTDRDNVKLSVCLCTLDRVGNFLGALGAKAEVAVAVAERDECLEGEKEKTR